ncbi:hypothetical protein HDU96_001609 [Phlyctochytrium bullatum]|nr:hypothetical protein HDU96_001609 [Phlyctochytrium bullatum]
MLIAVTGGNGFIASHIIEQLLANPSYRIRATVRSTAKGSQLTSLPNSKDRLTLVEADLSNPSSFDFTGCDVVLHVASPFHIDVKDPLKELVEPAKNGTVAVLEAAKKAGTVKTVVVTSSLAAITDEPRPGYVFTEDDWNTKSSLTRNPYHYSKLVAEKAAWEFVEKNPNCFDLVVVCPTFVIGPAHSKAINGSVDTIYRVATGAFPTKMNICWPYVDVRDVALAHIRAFERISVTKGKRYLCSGETWSMGETCDYVKAQFPKFASKIPSITAPDFLIYLGSYTYPSGTGSYLRSNLGAGGFKTSNERCRKDLGIEFREIGSVINVKLRAESRREQVGKIETDKLCYGSSLTFSEHIDTDFQASLASGLKSICCNWRGAGLAIDMTLLAVNIAGVRLKTGPGRFIIFMADSGFHDGTRRALLVAALRVSLILLTTSFGSATLNSVEVTCIMLAIAVPANFAANLVYPAAPSASTRALVVNAIKRSIAAFAATGLTSATYFITLTKISANDGNAAIAILKGIALSVIRFLAEEATKFLIISNQRAQRQTLEDLIKSTPAFSETAYHSKSMSPLRIKLPGKGNMVFQPFTRHQFIIDPEEASELSIQVLPFTIGSCYNIAAWYVALRSGTGGFYTYAVINITWDLVFRLVLLRVRRVRDRVNMEKMHPRSPSEIDITEKEKEQLAEQSGISILKVAEETMPEARHVTMQIQPEESHERNVECEITWEVTCEDEYKSKDAAESSQIDLSSQQVPLDDPLKWEVRDRQLETATASLAGLAGNYLSIVAVAIFGVLFGTGDSVFAPIPYIDAPRQAIATVLTAATDPKHGTETSFDSCSIRTSRANFLSRCAIILFFRLIADIIIISTGANQGLPYAVAARVRLIFPV